MGKFIHVIKTKVTSWESNIALLEHPYVGRVPGSDQDPLANVKLTVEDDHGVFYIFLYDVLATVVVVISTTNLLDLL